MALVRSTSRTTDTTFIKRMANDHHADIDWTAVFDGLSRTENVAPHPQHHPHQPHPPHPLRQQSADERPSEHSPLATHHQPQAGAGAAGGGGAHPWEAMFPPPPPVRTPGQTTSRSGLYAAVHDTSSAASTPRSVDAGPASRPPSLHRTESHPYSAPITPNHTGYNPGRGGGASSSSGDILAGLYISPESHAHHNRHATAAHRELEERLRRISGRQQTSDALLPHLSQHLSQTHNTPLGASAFPSPRSSDPAAFGFPSPHDLLNPQSSGQGGASSTNWPQRPPPPLDLGGSSLANILGPTLSPGPHQFSSTPNSATAPHSPWGFNNHSFAGPSTLHLNQVAKQPASTPPANGPPTPLQALDDTTEPVDQEDKRQRNTLASAKFRAKRKKHVETVQRRIGELEDEHSTLAREVSDLRNENKFLREMVELKYGLDVGPKKGVGTIKKGVGTSSKAADAHNDDQQDDDNEESDQDDANETAE